MELDLSYILDAQKQPVDIAMVPLRLFSKFVTITVALRSVHLAELRSEHLWPLQFLHFASTMNVGFLLLL
jgi:hypothetical protein